MARKNQLTTSDWLSYSEYEKLLNCLRRDDEYMWELFARLSFCTACRASDVLMLKWSQVFNKSEIVIKEKKTGKVRKIPLNSSVKNKIAELYDLLGCPDINNFIFMNEYRNQPITIQCVNKNLKRIKERHNVPAKNFSTHTFRKTFGRYVYETKNRSAESLILLNKIFKHQDINVTKAYIGITQEEINNVFDSIKF
jgi:integrase